ncbi:MAG: AAA family ATPase [Methanosarcinaceae archaeon]
MVQKIFIVGGEVEPPFFIGRDEEIEKIKLGVLTLAQNNVIIGPRRIGKTSLLRNLKLSVKDDVIFTFINCREMVSISDFFRITTKLLLEAYEEKHKIRGISQKFAQIFNGKITAAYGSLSEIGGSIEHVGGIYLKFRDDNLNEQDLIAETFEFIDHFSKEKEVPIVLCFDEFQELRKFNGSIFNVLKSRMDSQPDVRYIFSVSSISLLHDVFLKPDSPLCLMAAKMQLKPIKEEYIGKYIRQRLGIQNIQISDRALDNICTVTGGFPFYFQKLGFMVYQDAVMENKEKIKSTDVDASFCAMLAEFDSEFESRYIDKFSEQQKKILKHLSKEKSRRLSHIAKDMQTPASYLTSSMSDLQNTMTIEKSKEGVYRIIDNVFRIWLKRNISG